ncbi:MAG TPA: hypothetical protein VN132_16585 [Bdellovibrio sp.]|nr:hypothetical protein [Bdellovibrio sp.]
MKFNIIALLLLASGIAQADSFTEKVKVTGFHCDYGKPAIELRSLQQDRVLFLAQNESGEPQYLKMREGECQGMIQNLGNRLNGKIFDLNFETQQFSRTEKVYVPPPNPCEGHHTKCDDRGSYIDQTFEYLRTESLIDGSRFFNEQKTGQ